MKVYIFFSFLVLGLLFTSCNKKNKKDENVVSQRYIHKYGYDVSKDEWLLNKYPGQVVTVLKDGTTIASSYENGNLHGTTTFTYPYSQTIESLSIYENGNLIKKVSYNIKGLPKKEDIFLSDDHIKTSFWYNTGSPMCSEEYLGDKLVNAKYFNSYNDIESEIIEGAGTRIKKDQDGVVNFTEEYQDGKCIHRETYHCKGIPNVSVALLNDKLHGERKVFGKSSEPVSIENWENDKLDGLATYFQNGNKYLEIIFKDGLKHGIEKRYIDGDNLIEEITWFENKKHGSSTVYYDGMSKIDWFYCNEKVSKEKYDELCRMEKVVSSMNERSKSKESFYEVQQSLEQELD